MGLVKNLWRKLTNTEALDQSSGELETIFFESVYRLAYITGMSTLDRSAMYLLYSSAVKLSIFGFVCGELWCAYTELTSFDDIASSLNAILIQQENKDLYKKLASSMESPYFDLSTERRKKLVELWSDKNESYLKLLLALGNVTVVVWITYPLLDDVEYNHFVAIRLPFNYKSPVLYPVTYIILVIVFWFSAFFVMVNTLMMQTYLLHLLCQYTVLGDCFENLLQDCKFGFEDVAANDIFNNNVFIDTYTKRLGELIQQHKLILSHTMDLRNTLSAPMLAQLAASGTLICFIGYQATTTIAESILKSIMSFLFLGYNGFELYIICRWGEEITIQSQKLGEAIYCSGWECGTSKLPGIRASIMFVIMRANKPMYLTAGGMYNLSLTSFTTDDIEFVQFPLAFPFDAALHTFIIFLMSLILFQLVKTSYSALTVLLRFRYG